MIKRFTFQDCIYEVNIFNLDRQGNLWGLLDVLTPDEEGHLIDPRSLRLFHPPDWRDVALVAARNNSGNQDLWTKRGEQIRVALIEDPEIRHLLDSPQLHNSTSLYIGGGDVELRPESLSSRPRPGPREFIVEDIVPINSTTSLYGDSGQGKSYIACTLGQCVARGEFFLGLETKKVGVLLLDWELDIDEQTRRAYEIAEGMNYLMPPVGFDYLRVNQPFTQIVEIISSLVLEKEYGLVIIDSVGLACGGDSENTRLVVPFYLALSRLNTTTLVIDHQSRLQPGQRYRDKDAYGSIYKRHLSRSAIQVQVIVDEGSRKGLALRHAKANFGARRDETYAWLEFIEGNISLSMADESEMVEAGAGEEMNVSSKVKTALVHLGRATVESIAEFSAENSGSIGNELRKLRRKGLAKVVDKDGKAAVWQLEDAKC